MIKFDTKKIDTYAGNLLIPIPKGEDLAEIDRAMKNGKYIRVEISVPREKRSLSANNYCWALCQKIAEEMSKNDKVMKKEDVYRKAIVEMFNPITEAIGNDLVEDMKEAWESRGIGWICIDLGESTLYGQTKLGFYKGSSTFDSKEMSRLIDGLVQDAEALGLAVKSDEELNALIEQWERDRKK